MKKLLSVLLSLAMLLTCALAFAESADYIGVWYMMQMIENGEVYDATGAFDATVTLNEDGSANLVMNIMGESEESTGKWQIEGDGIVIDDGESALPGTLEDGNLKVDMMDTIMVFSREKVEIEMFDAGALAAEVSAEDFNGTWTGTLVDMMGMQMPYAEMNGISTVITIENGTAHVVDTPDAAASLDPNAVVEEYDMAAVFADNVLTLTGEADEYGNVETLAMQLHESGVLSASMEMSGLGVITTYYERVEAE